MVNKMDFKALFNTAPVVVESSVRLCSGSFRGPLFREGPFSSSGYDTPGNGGCSGIEVAPGEVMVITSRGDAESFSYAIAGQPGHIMAALDAQRVLGGGRKLKDETINRLYEELRALAADSPSEAEAIRANARIARSQSVTWLQ